MDARPDSMHLDSQADSQANSQLDSAVDPFAPPREIRRLRLDKGDHQFDLRYETGEESAVLQSLTQMVADPALPFDWFDAAVLGHQLGAHLAKELRDLVPTKAA